MRQVQYARRSQTLLTGASVKYGVETGKREDGSDVNHPLGASENRLTAIARDQRTLYYGGGGRGRWVDRVC